MNKTLIYILCLASLQSVAQQFPLSVVSVSGYEGSTNDGAYTVSSTLGETVMITLKGGGGMLTQGFHQGARQRCWSLTGEYPAEIQFDSGGYDPCRTRTVLLSQTAFNDFNALWVLNGKTVCTGWICTSSIDTGLNVIALSLSAEGCEVYGTDTLILTRGLMAEPQNDQIEVQQGAADPRLLLLTENDEDIEPGFTLEIQNPYPDLIFVNPVPQTPGAVEVSAGSRAAGNYTFSYKICNTGYCKECRTAQVNVSVGRLLGGGYNNGITPNGDGMNDVFILCEPCPGCDPCTNMELWIYNRWGDLVFKDENYNNNWTGLNAEGKELPAGTYFYYATINRVERTGSITIIR